MNGPVEFGALFAVCSFPIHFCFPFFRGLFTQFAHVVSKLHIILHFFCDLNRLILVNCLTACKLNIYYNKKKNYNFFFILNLHCSCRSEFICSIFEETKRDWVVHTNTIARKMYGCHFYLNSFIDLCVIVVLTNSFRTQAPWSIEAEYLTRSHKPHVLCRIGTNNWTYSSVNFVDFLL